MGRTKDLFEQMKEFELIRQNNTTDEFIFNKSFDFIACGMFYDKLHNIQNHDNRVLE
jgi:hypothetical protein